VTATHVALVILDVPAIADVLRAHADLDAVRTVLDAELGREDAPLGAPPKDDGSVSALFRRAHLRRRNRGTTPLDVLLTFYEHDLFPSARDALERAGLTYALVTAPSAVPSDPVEAGGMTLPYRASPSTATCAVRFWNDGKTTQELVVDLLVSELGKSPSAARVLMMLVHFDGSAVVGRCARDDAELLVARITKRAREAGYPLRVTIE
jgi:ATP-dependent Clp protease adaptor protein ClpS